MIEELKLTKQDPIGEYDYEPTKKELIEKINELVAEVNYLLECDRSKHDRVS